ncbi:uncharacterized protein PgNI_09035 [Pyricularia grisea]|uniref:D-isomer specific 2-hydroxyacid dehydrogenase NAD-binding domain-containing protein n=1 Tax=Pyricularia grisea TaxID=148305 RepID=A0A6P8AUD8_PYRGI|nr:uncharacterized protein PgNI_09035 [Pyricularia grisea]TLD05827.1 hypothetical protein PgNI_09035 [Pyricularia grisea]
MNQKLEFGMPPTNHVLLILMPWDPDSAWLASLANASPGIEVHSFKISYRDEKIPEEVPADLWARTTVLFTWRSFPTLEMVPNLQVVQILSAGSDHLQRVQLFKEQTDIKFCTANGVHPPQMTEWVFATFLASQHQIPQYLEYQKARHWELSQTDEDVEDAVGLRVGILGYGCIGRQCARVARSLGMDVYAYTFHERSTPESRRDESFTESGLGDPEGIFPSRWFHGDEQLSEFLGSGLDLLIITLPLTEKTRKMISTDQFKLLGKKKAYLSNVGRGAIVDTEALMEALDQGLIRGAALDVTDPEPLPSDHKLWDYKNVIITPHVSGNSYRYNERVCKILRYNLERMSEGKDLVNVVNKKLGY